MTFVALFSFQSSTAALRRLYYHTKFFTWCQILFKRKREIFFSLATSYSHRDKVPTTIGARELNFRVPRLACIRHAASVHPEPGSNSPKKCLTRS
ncbi:hypothetical protein FED53_19430 [Priestia flexa]|nr:hypothetical protein FED53_19430 [Priestia flexa]